LPTDSGPEQQITIAIVAVLGAVSHAVVAIFRAVQDYKVALIRARLANSGKDLVEQEGD